MRPQLSFKSDTVEFRNVDLVFVSHREQIVLRWLSKYMHDSQELLFVIVATEQRLAKKHFSYDTASSPHVDLAAVVLRPEDQLWTAVVARADVGHAVLDRIEFLARAEVAQNQPVVLRVDQQVGRLHVSVQDFQAFDVCQSPQQLVGQHLREHRWKLFAHLMVVLEYFVQCRRDEVHHDVEVDLLLVVLVSGEEVRVYADHVDVVELDRNREFAVPALRVLVDLLDGHSLEALDVVALEDRAERALADHLHPPVLLVLVVKRYLVDFEVAFHVMLASSSFVIV